MVSGMLSSQSCVGCVLGFVAEIEMKKVGFEGFKVILKRQTFVMWVMSKVIIFFGLLSSILAWKIPWTEEPEELQSMGLQKSLT